MVIHGLFTYLIKMHSSRMHTVRFSGHLGWWWGGAGGEVGCWGDLDLPGGCVPMWVSVWGICLRGCLRVPTRPGKPGKIRVHLENLQIVCNFENFNKCHGKMI